MCNTCGVDRPLEDFPWRYDGKRNSDGSRKRRCPCKFCKNGYQRGRWAESPQRSRAQRRAINAAGKQRCREAILSHLLCNPCVDCGETDPVVLEFDHRDRNNKRAGIATMAAGGYAVEAIIAEIEKCDVRCANCHKRVTARQFGWFKSGALGSSLPAGL